MMTLRYCPRCRAEVEDTGGFCLLGHRFPIAAEDPIADLRREVDQAFKKVELDISDVFEQKLEEPVPAPSGGVYEQLKSDSETLDEIVQSRRDVWQQLSDDGPVDRNDPIVSFSPSPRMEWGRDRRRRRKGDE